MVSWTMVADARPHAVYMDGTHQSKFHMSARTLVVTIIVIHFKLARSMLFCTHLTALSDAEIMFKSFNDMETEADR